VAIEMRRRLADRVPALVLMDWLVLDPPPPFLDAVQALQDPDRWQQTRDQLFALWLTGAPARVGDQIRREMGAYGFDMWCRAPSPPPLGGVRRPLIPRPRPSLLRFPGSMR